MYADTIRNKNVREVGAEWLSLQALQQLKIDAFLRSKGWSDSQINLALTQIISRAVYPASELKTSKWIKENSAVCELTEYPVEKITKDKLYGSALDLYSVKNELEVFLSTKTNELFDLQDKIYLYDLTNTYFEGEKRSSKIAKHGRSKEKRNDAKLVVLAVVVNTEGFIKYSSIYEGNMADCKTLSATIDSLRVATSSVSKKAVIVMDAGIATEENLKMVKAKGFDYLCVTRTKIKKFDLDNAHPLKTVLDKKDNEISLQKITVGNETDYFLKIKSNTKALKEASMHAQFKQRFEEGLQIIEAGLSKKSGVKKEDKVHQRIGRLKQKYPSIQKHYSIETLVNENKEVTRITWKINDEPVLKESHGVYFLRTSLDLTEEATVWKIYNTIREIEYTFRVLKTDLDLRPIYHKNDDSTMAHLHLGLLAYWVVNTIRYQLKAKGITIDWQEIVRITNTQKMITTTAQNAEGNTVYQRKCSEPEAKIITLYQALNYKSHPKIKTKFVVLKIEPEKQASLDTTHFNTG
ncbi:MAG: IS1634 family transposase [Parachlamydiaceae bacterium]|nr:IS1634 family transposase [Parachlamydiaceae bacterium]